MRKVRIFGGPATKSFSLREENAEVSPTYFEWHDDGDYNSKYTFYTDWHLRAQNAFEKSAVALLLEPRCLRPENYFAMECKGSMFKVVLTYDKELLDKLPNARFYPFGGSSISFDKWGIYPKSKDVCMFLSDKKTTEGHKLRHKIAEEFGDRIDVYRNFESKFDILKDYRYCVVVESCRQDFYASEKLIDAISVGTQPIYWGSTLTYRDLAFQNIWQFSTFEHFKGSFEFRPNFNFHSLLEAGIPEMNMGWAKEIRIMEDWIFEHYPDLFEEQC